jgi:hypothetical protein
MNRSRTDTLGVPGATLHYEICGMGPLLLLIAGGPADAGGFAPIRNVLCDRYTVLTYDPRGLSRSPFDGEAQDTTVQTFAHDAHRLLATLGTERPATLYCNASSNRQDASFCRDGSHRSKMRLSEQHLDRSAVDWPTRVSGSW